MNFLLFSQKFKFFEGKNQIFYLIYFFAAYLAEPWDLLSGSAAPLAPPNYALPINTC